MPTSYAPLPAYIADPVILPAPAKLLEAWVDPDQSVVFRFLIAIQRVEHTNAGFRAKVSAAIAPCGYRTRPDTAINGKVCITDLVHRTLEKLAGTAWPHVHRCINHFLCDSGIDKN